MKLSEHFSLDEMTRSDYAVRHDLKNDPSPEYIQNLIALCRNTLEPLREIIKKPIHISSGYRSPEVNEAIGGTKNSQHILGCAADIDVQGLTIAELFDVASKFVPYDQVIHEFGQWVHISYALPLRKDKLRAVRENRKTVYQRV
ncbi:MAG: D-Ala-D-Ala carboxypeptidase family metallohydrolase [Bacteroidota bacterium]|jgi:uncharacterized protein YcbK (DUF882 family)